MFTTFLAFVAGNMLYFMLHLESSSFPRPLTKAEEAECFEALRQGDMAARDKLISHNLRLVAHVVKKYYPGTADNDDLISIGTIGLIKAVASFDPDKHTRFSTFAAKCIENEVLMFFRSGKKSGGTLSINEPIDSERGDGDLTLSDVLADSVFVDEACEQKSRGGENSTAGGHPFGWERAADCKAALWIWRQRPADPAGDCGAAWHFAQLCISAREESS